MRPTGKEISIVLAKVKESFLIQQLCLSSFFSSVIDGSTFEYGRLFIKAIYAQRLEYTLMVFAWFPADLLH